MKLFCFAFLVFLFLSCRNGSEGSSRASTDLRIDWVHAVGSGMGEGGNYVDMENHYLILKRYNGNNGGGWDDFIRFADNYRDTARSAAPISSVTIVKPYRSTLGIRDIDDWMEFREHFLLGINYSHQTMHEKLADIRSLAIWQDGEPYSVELLTEKRMKKLTGYLDSNGKYSDQWWDRYKKQAPESHHPDSVLKTADHTTNHR